MCTTVLTRIFRHVITGALCVAVICVNALAQTPITSSGLQTDVSPPISLPSGQTQYNITGGTRPGGGTNLFHSFGDFNVPTNNIANFLNDAGLPTSNILGRVTGGNPSVIYGLIQTNGPGGFGNANLFLMNPYGFLFGPNAALNVGGMVAFTTADYLRFQNSNTLFNNASTPESLNPLSIAPVSAFGFLGSNPAAVAVQGSILTVAPGQSLSLVGGSKGFEYVDPDTGLPGSVPDGLSITGGLLSAPSGQINVAAIASAGEILHPNLELSSNINGDLPTNLGQVNISGGAVLDVSGSPGGTVRIRSGELVLDGSFLLSTTSGDIAGVSTAVQLTAQNEATIRNGSAIVSFSDGAGRGGDIEINATTIHILDGSAVFAGSSGSAPAGAIRITATDSLSLAGTDPAGSGLGSAISNNSFGDCGCTDPSGNIEINTRALTLDDQATIQTRTFADRRPGDILLHVDDLTVRNGSAVQTFGSDLAPSGSIGITATGTITLSGQFDSDTPSRITSINEGTAGTGNILIDTGSLFLEGGARIRNEALASPEPGSDPKIAIQARDTISLSGASNIRVLNVATDVGGIEISGNTIALAEQSVIRTETFGDGNAGSVHIQGEHLAVTGGSLIESSTFDNNGRGGNIDIHLTGDLSLTGHVIGEFGEILASNISSRTTGSGAGGNILIAARNTQITDGAFISAASAGTGNAGSVTIQGTATPAQSVLIDGPGSGIFTTTSGTGAGGNIIVNADTVTLQNGGTLSAATSGTEPSATGGSITVAAPDQVSMTGGASITASSTGPADAGNIFINAGRQLEMHDSSIKTEAAQASGGNIEIQAIDRVSLVNSTISTSVLGGSGSGGNITIDPTLISLSNSNILAQAILGSGGNIRLIASLLLVDPTSLISASSEFGQSGTIQSPTSNLAGSVGSLPSSTRQGQVLQAQRCAVLRGGESSSFIIAGRDTVPTEPGGWMVSSLGAPSAGTGQGTRGEGDGSLSGLSSLSGSVRTGIPSHQIDQIDQINQIDQIDEPPILSLRRLTPAGFLTQHFPEGETGGCRS